VQREEKPMHVIPNSQAREIPWCPGHRNFILASREQGLDCIAYYSVLEPGAGAPLHLHEAVDEVFVILESALEFRLGDEHHVVEADHTIAVPAGMPHAFVAASATPVRMFVFMPQNSGLAAVTSYLEGTPPASADLR
jgi:mannose-6-phosphate isomerase-like protein (cupin superfamily)